MFTHDEYWELFAWTMAGLAITVATYGIAMQFGWITSISWIEFAGVALNYSCVILTSRQKQINWPLGIVAVLFLGVLFWQLQLYASLALSIGYFLPVQFYGWYVWQKKGPQKADDLPVTQLGGYQLHLTVACGVMAFFVVAFVDQYFGGVMTIGDALIMTISIIAQYLLTWKKLESWFLWIAVNLIAIYVYYQAGAPLLAVQYLLFLGNALYGAYSWYKAMPKTVHSLE